MDRARYLDPHQARDREPDDYQNLLGDAIERGRKERRELAQRGDGGR